MSSVDNPTDTCYQEYQLDLNRKSIAPDRIGNVSFAINCCYYMFFLLLAERVESREKGTVRQLLLRQISRSAFSDYTSADFTFPFLPHARILSNTAEREISRYVY